MSNAITLPRSVLNDLITRISKLEIAVFGKKGQVLSTEKIILKGRVKDHYKHMDEDFKKGKNFYSFDDPDQALDFLLSNKRT